MIIIIIKFIIKIMNNHVLFLVVSQQCDGLGYQNARNTVNGFIEWQHVHGEAGINVLPRQDFGGGNVLYIDARRRQFFFLFRCYYTRHYKSYLTAHNWQK